MAAAEAIQVKQLGELLKEQQEPFTLETYLSERKIRVTNSGSSKHQRKKPRNGNLLLLPKLFTVVYSKLFKARNSDEPGNTISSSCVNENSCSSTEERIMSSFASTSSTTTISNSPSDLDTEHDDDQREKEVDADGSSCRWRMMEETKEHSPVSVLPNITTSHQVSKFPNLLEPAEPTKRIITESSILSASLWSILLQYPATQVRDCINSSSQSFMTKQVLERNGQLLFDCVTEVTEGKHKACMSEDIGKLICKRINAWGTQAEDRTHAKAFADLDLGLGICRGIEEQKREVGLAIGDAIFETMTDEIVPDMLINLTNM